MPIVVIRNERVNIDSLKKANEHRASALVASRVGFGELSKWDLPLSARGRL